jgi:hypothetical protein
MAPLARDEKFQLRLTGDERRMLEAIAEYQGLSASDKIRQLIREAFVETFGEASPKRPRPKRK